MKHCGDGRGWQQSLTGAVQFHFFSSVNEPVFRRHGSAEGAFTYFNFSLLPFSFHMSLVQQALFKQYYEETSFFVMYFSFLSLYFQYLAQSSMPSSLFVGRGINLYHIAPFHCPYRALKIDIGALQTGVHQS